MNMATIGIRRTASMAAVFMIGNGALGLLEPGRRIGLWTSDVAVVDRFVRADRARSPAGRRRSALVQIGAGMVLGFLSG